MTSKTWVNGAFIGAFLIFGCFTSPRAMESGISPSKEAAKEVVRSRPFPEKRDLATYLKELPIDFAKELVRLDGSSRVLDAGAGGFYFAEDVVNLSKSPANDLSGEKQKWLHQLVAKPIAERPSVTGVSLNLEREELPSSEKLKLLWGRFFLEIEDSELGQFDLITDLNGIFAYGPNADEILRKYQRLLKRKGEVFLYLGEDKENGFAYRSKVKLPNGKVITLADWIQTIPGLRVTRLSSEADDKEHLTFRISVRNPRKLKIPKLALMGIDTSAKGAPTRMYYQK